MKAEASVEVAQAPPAERPLQAADRRVLPALCLAAFVGLLTFLVPAPFFPAMARDLSVGVPLLGQIVAAMLLISGAFGLVAGPLADRYGHRRLMVLGLASAAVCLFAFGLAPAFPVLLVAALAGGLGNAAVLGPSLAVASTYFAGPALRRALGWTTAGRAGSAIVGVPLMTAAGAIIGWRLAFIAVAVAVIGATVLGAAWLPRDARHPAERLRLKSILEAYQPLVRHRPTMLLYGVAVLRAIGWFGMLTYFGAFLGQRLALTTGQIGFAYMLSGAGYFLGSLVAGGPLGHVSPRLLLIAGNISMALLMGLAFSAILGPAGTVAVMPLAGFAGAASWVAIAALLTAGSPAGPGTTMTLHDSLFNFGASLGGAIGGLLLALGGYGALVAGLPIFGLGAALLAWWPERRSQR